MLRGNGARFEIATQGMLLMRERGWLSTVLVLVAAVAAGVQCLIAPPLLAFEPRPQLAIAAIVASTIAALWPGHRPIIGWVRLAGTAMLWLVIFWRALSQTMLLTQPVAQVQAQRALPLFMLAGAWAILWLPRSWQQRAALAVLAPSVLAMSFVGWGGVPQTAHFQPYYLALDSHGTLYVTDKDASVIRIFGSDGTLRAKLWPGLARYQGPPGPGFSATGPFNDPDRLGLSPITSAAKIPPNGTWTPRRDPFQFCGLAVDAHDQLYVPDPRHGVVLRFDADGHLQLGWSLPADYQPPADCVTVTATGVYLVDQRGIVLKLSPTTGQTLARWTLPDAAGGVTASADGAHLYVLSVTHIYVVNTSSGALEAAWALAVPSGGIAALSAGRVAVADHLHSELDVYCADGHLCDRVGTVGEMPGQFWLIGSLATDRDGHLYAADFGHRVVQSFTPAGHVSAVYWSIEDEQEIGERHL